MIYLDNAATSMIKPKIVNDAVIEGLKQFTANPGRSSHMPAQNCALQIFEVRQKVAKFFNASSEESVIFTKNCTEALNLAIFGTAITGGHVITTIYEHNSVLRPLHRLVEEGRIDLTVLEPNKEGFISFDLISTAMKPNTYLVVINHISNVTGKQQDIKKIGEFCKQKNILFIVDAAQSAGHEIIDVQENNISILCFAGHKGLFAITGSGGLIVETKQLVKPILCGGTGTYSELPYQPNDIPEGFESGTLPVLPIISLGAGIDFVVKNFELIKNQEDKLNRYMYSKLNALDFLEKYFDENSQAVFSFNIKNMTSSQVGNILNSEYGICVRTGLHCAPLVHKYLNTTSRGTVRASISAFNKIREIDEFIVALENIYYCHKTKDDN